MKVSFSRRAKAITFHKFNNVTSIVQEFFLHTEDFSFILMKVAAFFTIYTQRISILPSISRREENEKSLRTHEFSIIERYSTLFLPYWDYIKAWNWGFSSFRRFILLFSPLHRNNIKIFHERKILWQMRNLNFFVAI